MTMLRVAVLRRWQLLRVPVTGAAVAALMGVTTIVPVHAQSLTAVPGQTDFQNRVGGAVATVCGALGAAATDRTGASDVEDLFGRCQDLVQTANDVIGAGGVDFSLGLNATELNDALLEVAHEESTSQGSSSTDTSSGAQTSNVGGRLAAVRAGASGLSLSGLNFNINGGTVPGVAVSELFQAVGGGEAGDSGLASGQDSSDADFGRLGLFVSGSWTFGDRDSSDEEIGFDFNAGNITFGADYRVSDNFVAGGALGYGRTENDFDNAAGELEQDSIMLSLYGTLYAGESFYVDAIATYAFNDYDQERNIVYSTINRVADGETEGDEYSITVGGGYDFFLEAWNVGPYARAALRRSDIDGFTETGAQGLNLQYSDQEIRSLSTALGAQVSRAISTDFGVLSPQLRVEWEHEFDDGSREISVQYAADPNNNQFFVITDGADKNFFNVGASLAATLPGGITAFADYETVLGLENVSMHIFTVGARMEF